MTLGVGKLCGQCEYDLTGLPPRGACPECGQYYNMRTGQGISTTAGEQQRRADRIMARVRTILLLVAIVVVMGCGGLLSWLVHLAQGKWLTPIVMAGMISVILLMAAMLSYLNEREV